MHKKIKRILVYVILILIIFVIDLPVINMIGVSFKSPAEIMTNNGLLPKSFTLVNFKEVLAKSNFLIYVKNSLIVSATVTALTAVVASMAGYAISRYTRHFRILGTYSKLMLLMQMFPTILLLIPLFMIFKNVGLSGSLLSVILIYMTYSLPFGSWMMSGFFDGVPIELDEAAKADGCNAFQTFVRIIMPVSGPGLASTCIYTFIYCWNEYMLASIFLKAENVKTLPVGIQVFMQQYSTEWGQMMASSTMAVLPVAFFLIFMQKNLVAGLTSGAVKG